MKVIMKQLCLTRENKERTNDSNWREGRKKKCW